MKTLSDNIKPILAILIMVSTIVYIFMTTFIPVKSQDSQGLIAMIGFAGSVIGYYIGYSQGAAKKDETIQDLSKGK